jgi:hypothetical protein
MGRIVTTIAKLTDTALKHATPRSIEYRRGIEAVLRFKFHGERIQFPYRTGTPQADAYFSGNDRGWEIYKAEVQRQAEATEAIKSRVFFADADAL